MNIIIIILLFLATRGAFALYHDLKKVVWLERMTDEEVIKETLDRR